MSNPVYVAIDTPMLDDALDLVRKVKAHVGGVKLGLEFFCANGHHGVHEVQKLGLPIFLDLKLHDIPNTVAKAMQAINTLEPAIVTIHASGGRAMMEDAKAAAGIHTKVVGVTVLTSLDDHDLSRVGVADAPDAQVARLAALAQEAGLSEEIEHLLFGALQSKDASAVAVLTAGLPASLAEAFAALPQLYGGRTVLAEARVRLPALPAVVAALDTLEAVESGLAGVEVAYDLAELRGYGYHNGVVFAAYTAGRSSAIAQGGRYDEVGKVFGRARPATGFSLDLRELAVAGA